MSTSTIFNIFSPEPMPVEFSQALLSIFDSDTVNHEFVKELVFSLATRTADPMLQYLCSGATYFAHGVVGYSSLLTALIPLDLQGQLNHLKTFLDALPAVFTRAVNQLNTYVDTLNLQLPLSLQQLRSSLANPVKNVQHTLQYLIVFYNIDQYVQAGKEEYSTTLFNAVRICIAWISAIASYLRLNSLALAHTAVEALERTGKSDSDLIPSIQSSFGVVNTFSPSAIDISHYQPLLQSAAVIITTLIPYIDKLVQGLPENHEFTHIVKFKDDALTYMNLLQSALDRVRGIPPEVVQQDASIFIQNLYSTVDYFAKALSEQPDMFPSLQSDLKLQAFIAFLLFDVLKAADTTKLKHLFSQLYSLDNLTDIVNKSTEIQEEMQVVNQAIYGVFQQQTTQSAETKTTTTKKEVIKQTIVEVVKTEQVVSPKPEKTKPAPPKVEEVKPTGPIIDPPRKIDPSFYTLDFHNTSMLTNALALITNIEARESTIADINEFLNNPENALNRNKLEDSVRKVLVMRAENQYQLDIAAIAAMNEQTMFEKSLEIATVVPIYAGTEQEEIHKLVLPLYLQQDRETVVQAVRVLLTHLTYIIPLRQRVDSIVKIIKNEARSVEPEISETVKIFQIKSRAKGGSDREKEIFDLATFLAYADSTRIGEFCEYNVQQWLTHIRQRLTMEQTRQITYDMVKSCIVTATVKQCYDVNVMRCCNISLEALDEYLEKQGDSYRLKLIGTLCLLPTEFKPCGSMDIEWASTLCLITPTALNDLISISSSSLESHLSYTYSLQTEEEAERAKNKNSAKGLMAQSSSSSSSDEDDEPRIIYEDVVEEEEIGEPEIIEDVEEVTIEEEEDVAEDFSMNDELMKARTLEYVRNALRLLKQYNDAAMNLEAALVNARFESFYLCAYDLIKMVPKQDADKLNEILQTSSSIAKQIIGYNDRSSVSQLESSIGFLRQLKHSLTGKSSSSIVISELVLLQSYSDQLYSLIEADPSDLLLNTYDPFKKQVVIESREVLKSIRILSRRAIKLIQQLNDVSHWKPLVKAIAQTSESVQLFYLYVRNTEHDDDILRSVVSNGCRKMQSALSCMVMLIPKSLPDDYNEIRSLNADIVSHLDYMIDMSEQKVFNTKASPQQQKETTVETTAILTEKRLDAEALVIKRRKELSDAEAEVQRLKAS
ncbi:hypothetical protein TRFO_17687 [Tritrichomonas foetus]|uniref:Uncharacterized protein n=1 Tax=Tritrichomonas foetus TaxID=1144522 RepID=A0A1J4KMT6_9EUKA|nr:hypothetical protein TRFO_17687 [Tritrichomonas foetus]|eukprot:OHT12426.1 hypothetical protein TRFO_17687 [Tritrichomonas foetus]